MAGFEQERTMNPSSAVSLRYRLAIASRATAAAVGGYALSVACTMLLSLIWPAPPAQAVMWATMLSFAVYAFAVLWAFATPSALRAWLGLSASTVLVALSVWLLRTGVST